MKVNLMRSVATAAVVEPQLYSFKEILAGLKTASPELYKALSKGKQYIAKGFGDDKRPRVGYWDAPREDGMEWQLYQQTYPDNSKVQMALRLKKDGRKVAAVIPDFYSKDVAEAIKKLAQGWKSGQKVIKEGESKKQREGAALAKFMELLGALKKYDAGWSKILSTDVDVLNLDPNKVEFTCGAAMVVEITTSGQKQDVVVSVSPDYLTDFCNMEGFETQGYEWKASAKAGDLDALARAMATALKPATPEVLSLRKKIFSPLKR